jgi:hypothetical protein
MTLPLRFIRRRLLPVLIVGALLSIALPAFSISLTATDRGWFRSDGLHTAGQNNTYTGTLGGREYRSFYAFDVDNIGGNWNQATLELTLDLFHNGDASESIEIFAVSSPAASVMAGHAAGSASGQAIFNDLGTGVSYGTATLTAGDVGSVVSLVLNASAVADINAARGGQWVFAIVHTTPSGGTQGLRFGTNGAWDTGNTSGAAIPEPTQTALLVIALLALAKGRRIRT